MKVKLLSLFTCLLVLCSTVFGQSAANYTFSTGTNGNFTTGLGSQTIDMNSGTTTIIDAGLTNTASTTFPTGFEFFLSGTRYTSFSVASNGMIGLNALMAPTVTLAGGASGRIAPFAAGITGYDMGTHTTGKVHYKVIGTYPNRVCVIEYLNMSIPRSSNTADATFQVRLYETSGVIEFVYGNMNASSALTGVRAGFSTTTTNYQTINFTSNTSSTTPVTDNSVAVGAIANLNSTTEGSRRYYRFTPPTISAATLVIGTTTPGSIPITVTPPTPSTGIYGYGIYAYPTSSTLDYVASYFGALSAAGGSTNLVGLTPNTTYNLVIVAYSEGFTASVTQSATTAAPGTVTSVATGNWTDGTTWSTGTAPARGDNVVIAAGHTVTVSTTAVSYVNDLTISGTLGFSAASGITATGNILVNAGGTLNMFNGTAGLTLNLNGNLTNNGTVDLSKASAGLQLLGSTTQTISGPTTGFVGSGVSGSPANTGIIRTLVLNNTAGAVLNTPLIVNNAITLTNGNIAANSTLTLDNTQTSTGVTAPTSVTVTRQRGTATLSGTVAVGTAATYNLSYNATTFGSNAVYTAGAEAIGGTFNNLTVQNTLGVNFSSAVTVKGTLAMNANLNMGSNNFTLGTSAAAPGTLTYSQGFITTTGTVTRWLGTSAITIGGSAGLFPIGVGSNNRSFWVGGTPTTGGTVTVKYNSAVGTTSLPTFVENAVSYNLRSNTYWQVAAANGLTGTDFSIRMQGSNIGGVNSFADVNMSLAINAAPGTFSAGTLANVDVQANRTGLTDANLNNNFYFATNAAQNPLPITLTNFAGSLKNNNAILSWSTTNEVNADRFEVERNNNGTWSNIASVTAKGTASNTYQAMDANLAVGKWQYRLKMVDKDGRFSYSQIVTLDLNGKGLFVLGQNYPNPVKGSTQVSYQVNTDAKVIIELLTNDGRKIATLVNQQQAAGSYNITMDLTKYGLASGNYIYRMVALDRNNKELFQSSKTITVVP